MATDPRKAARPKYDAAYKSLFARRRTVADTLSGAARELARHLDFSTLRKLPASFVTEQLGQRHADMLWRVQTRSGEWIYVIVLLEFQSTVDRSMALRMHDYTLRILQGLDRDQLGASGEFPAVLPVVVYNGKRPWTAARDFRDLFGPVPEELVGYLPRHRYLLVNVRELDPETLPGESALAMIARLEQASTPSEVTKLLAPLGDWLGRIGDPELERAFGSWVCHSVLRRHGPEGEEMARRIEQGDKEFRMTALAEMFERAGRERDQEWLEKGRVEGIERGRIEGVERGRIEGKRELARQVVARRFGVDAAERLLPRLEELSDPKSIEAVVDAAFESASPDELLARVGDA